MKRSLNVPALFVCFFLFLLPVSAQQKTWDSLMQEANQAGDQKRFVEAEGLYREALRALETRSPQRDQPILRVGTLAQLAKAIEGQSKTAEAELVGASAVDLLEANLKDFRSLTAGEKIFAKMVTEKVYLEVADIFIAHKKLPEAESLLLRLIRHQEGWTKEAKTRTDRILDSSTGTVGSAEAIQGALLEASAENPTGTYIKLGNLYFGNKDFPKAENCFQEALKLSTPSPIVPRTNSELSDPDPVLLTNLGTSQAAQKKWQPAEANLLKAIVLFQRRNQLNSAAGQNALRNYALALKKQDRSAEAETFLDKIQAGEVIVPK